MKFRSKRKRKTSALITHHNQSYQFAPGVAFVQLIREMARAGGGKYVEVVESKLSTWQ